MDSILQIDHSRLNNQLERLREYNSKLKNDIENLSNNVYNIEQNWSSSGKDIEGITNELKNQIKSIQETIIPSLDQYIDVLNSFQE